jgi:hypothetical protein
MGKSRLKSHRKISKTKRPRSYRLGPSNKGCSYGFIRRKGYSVKKRSGRSYKVPSSCIKERGRKGSGRRASRKLKIIQNLKTGQLTQYGYHADLSQSERRKCLRRKIRKESKTKERNEVINKTIKQLNAIYTLTKNSDPEKAQKYKKDEEYVRSLKDE